MTRFEGNFTFATVHTAGHEVPAYQPKVIPPTHTLHFLLSSPLRPLLSSTALSLLLLSSFFSPLSWFPALILPLSLSSITPSLTPTLSLSLSLSVFSLTHHRSHLPQAALAIFAAFLDGSLFALNTSLSTPPNTHNETLTHGGGDHSSEEMHAFQVTH